MYLVAMEISKKQNYIFKSNKLKENIGASLIIKYVTEDLWKKFIGIGKEIYSGGGNSYFEFDSDTEAKDFIKNISFEIMKNYESLEFYTTQISGEFNKENMDKIKIKLGEKKLQRSNSFKKVSFGVEEICKSTSTPAMEFIDDGKESENKRAVSKETWLKNGFFEYLNKGNKSKFKELSFLENIDDSYKQFTDKRFPLDLDEFGENKNSYLAIVNIDGNKMGNMVNKIIEENEKNGEKLKIRLKNFSDFIKDSYDNAFKTVIQTFESKNIDKNFPIRPIVLAGDDVTYIIESKYALESVKIFTENIEKGELIDKFPEFKGISEKLTVGAGVVFVNKKAPFNKAYEMAEDLCKNAKRHKKDEEKDNKEINKKDISTIDWHILKGEFDDINNIRNRVNHKLNSESDEEKKEEKSMFIRPMGILEDVEKEEKEIKRNLIRIFETVDFIKNEENKIKTGKLNELLGIFDDGKTEVKIFINKYRLTGSIEKINTKFGLADCKEPYKESTYHIHDILELCNEKFYKRSGDK